MVQQDLFATIKPPSVDFGPSQVVEAAAQVERARRKRSEVAQRLNESAPFVAGPISDATGGPLSAEEAERVITGKTIRCSGYQFQDGTSFCKSCLNPLIASGSEHLGKLHALHGYRGVLYGGAEYKGGLTCAMCSKPIAP